MNRQPYSKPPRWWAPGLSPWMVRATRGLRRHRIHKHVKFCSITSHGMEHVTQALNDDCGVMIAANHSVHWDSEAIYCAFDKINQPVFVLTAWQVFGALNFWQQWLLQGMGCFSIDREGSDRKAFKESVRILKKENYPLMIFPEGDIYHTNDRITNFREGMASIAMSAARSNERKIVIIPCAVKIWYLDDPRPSLKRVLTRLEQRLMLRPAEKLPLVARIVRLGNAALSLKEIEYRGHLTAGTLHCRRNRLIEFILENLETNYGNPHTTEDVRERVKNLRQTVIQKLEDELNKGGNASEKLVKNCRLHMEDLFTVTQLYSYPDDYLDDNPSVERIAETVDKLEEDIDFAALPTTHGRKRVDVTFGEPLDVIPTRTRGAMVQLASQTRDHVQAMIDATVRT